MTECRRTEGHSHKTRTGSGKVFVFSGSEVGRPHTVRNSKVHNSEEASDRQSAAEQPDHLSGGTTTPRQRVRRTQSRGEGGAHSCVRVPPPPSGRQCENQQQEVCRRHHPARHHFPGVYRRHDGTATSQAGRTQNFGCLSQILARSSWHKNLLFCYHHATVTVVLCGAGHRRHCVHG